MGLHRLGVIETPQLPVKASFNQAVDNPALAAAFTKTRESMLAVYRHLNPSQRVFAQQSLINLPAWELGHMAWFQEFWCLRYNRHSGLAELRKPLIALADERFDSRRVSHAARWLQPYDWQEIDDYLAATLTETIAAIAETAPADRYFFELALRHEEMHREALLMSLQYLGLPAPSPVASVALALKPCDLQGWLVVPAGLAMMGAERDEVDFVFDNEKWRGSVAVAEFAMAAAPVTVAEYADFMHGAYLNPAHWCAAGWAWLNGLSGQRASAPLGTTPAQRAAGQVAWFGQMRQCSPTEPVINLSWYEAAAFAQFAGARLPTEAEWVRAAQTMPAFLPSTGQAWEWTASVFAPFPGFAADPYAEYSAPWFGDHYVLKGGSWVTHQTLKSLNYRNFYLPERSDMFSTVRLARAINS